VINNADARLIASGPGRPRDYGVWRPERGPMGAACGHAAAARYCRGRLVATRRRRAVATAGGRAASRPALWPRGAPEVAT